MIKLQCNTVAGNLDTTSVKVPNPIGADNPPPLTPDHANTNTATQNTLDATAFFIDWATQLPDNALQQLAVDGVVCLDDLFCPTALLALQAESGFIDYREATLTDGERIKDIRGDKIRWITQDFFAGRYYLHSINTLAQWLNQQLFVGIRHSEAHYACYPAGTGYVWHSDNPQGRDERVISAVFYLNDDWHSHDGGALQLLDRHGIQHSIIPTANRLLIFDSNLPHQVQIAHRQRYSIATWLRRDDLLPFAIAS